MIPRCADTELRVMTSGTFTAAYLALAPRIEVLIEKTLVTAATSIGTGDNYIPSRLQRGEIADVVIVANDILLDLIERGLVLRDSYTPLVRSSIGVAVRAGAHKPDVHTIRALRRTLLHANSIVYSSSVSGTYVSSDLFSRLGIAKQVERKSWSVANGERVGIVVARGDAEIGFQQISELLPIPGIDHITPLPAAVQKTTIFSAGIAATSQVPKAAECLVRHFISLDAAQCIRATGLEPIHEAQVGTYKQNGALVDAFIALRSPHAV